MIHEESCIKQCCHDLDGRDTRCAHASMDGSINFTYDVQFFRQGWAMSAEVMNTREVARYLDIH
ncbi:MAG: hypothetical protein ACXWMH_07580, partial [Syntrophales bacterium]